MKWQPPHTEAGGELVVVVGGGVRWASWEARLHRDLVCVCHFPQGVRGSVPGPEGGGCVMAALVRDETLWGGRDDTTAVRQERSERAASSAAVRCTGTRLLQFVYA